MYLLGKKVKPKFIHQPFGADVDLPQPLEEKTLLAIVQALRAGTISQSEREQLYSGHIRLAIYIAGQYATRTPRRTPDLIGEALLAIGDAIRRAPEALQDDNFTPFCAGRIHSTLSAFISNDHTVRYPERTFTHHQTRYKDQCSICGHPRAHHLHDERSKADFNEAHDFVEKDRPRNIITYSIHEEKSEASDSEERVERRFRHRHARRHRCLEVRSEIGFRDLKELIAKAIQTDEERTIMAYREMGYNDMEIGQKMGKSNVWVQTRRAKVETRFEKMEKEAKS